MNPFKFFQKDIGPAVIQLHKYHKKLIDIYMFEYNLHRGEPNHDASEMIGAQVIYFIDNGHITSFGEIRSYYKESYRYLNNDVDTITDEEHENLVRMVEYETRFYL
jgi:hypothetical protein